MKIFLKIPIAIVSIFMVLIAISGCATYTVPKASLLKQLDENQDVSIQTHISPFTVTDYPSNNLKRIKCVDKNGNDLWLYPDKNTEFRITQKSDDKKVRTYFDTLILQNDTLYGLRSRILGGLRVIPANNIAKIEIHSEFPKTEKIH